MVEVVFQEVVFGKVGDVAGLDGGEEVDVGGVGGEGDDVDHFGDGRFLVGWTRKGGRNWVLGFAPPGVVGGGGCD